MLSQINERKAMRNPGLTLANDTHREKPVGSLIFEKDYSHFGHQSSGHESSKTKEIYAHGSPKTVVKFKNPFKLEIL